jgi:hypothetical protein
MAKLSRFGALRYSSHALSSIRTSVCSGDEEPNSGRCRDLETNQVVKSNHLRYRGALPGSFMRNAFAATVLVSSIACFDFTATVEADIGGECGDLDHYCASGLVCFERVCRRPNGSELNERCDADIPCADELACSAGLCVALCDALVCGDHGQCEVHDGAAGCSCDAGYENDNNFCASSLGTACAQSSGQRCAPRLTCSVGTCVEACGSNLCLGGTICDTDSDPQVCVCPPGTQLDIGLQCASVCTDVTCLGHGRCIVNDGTPLCECDSGYELKGSEQCVPQGCAQPSSHASSICDSGHIYWQDSCFGLEEIRTDCGARGCSGLRCNDIRWVPRDLTFSANNIRATDFAVGSSGRVVAVAANATGLTLASWSGTWGDFSSAGNVIATTTSVGTVSVVLDSNERPQLAYGSTRVVFTRWNGGAWEGLASSDAESVGVDSTTNALSLGLALDGRGFPIVGYVVLAGMPAFFPVVRQWDGNRWFYPSGTALLPTSPAPFRPIFVAATSNGTVVAGPHGAVSFDGSLLRWSGSAWVDEMPRFAIADATIGFAAQSGRMVYVAPQADNDIHARTWSGAAYIDSTVSTNTSATVSRGASVVLASDGRAYVAWQEGADTILVRRENGSGGWEDVGPQIALPRGLANDSASAVAYPVIRNGGKHLCVSWRASGATMTMRCALL